MPRSQPAFRRGRSHAIALAAVAASFAAVPRAEAGDYYWNGFFDKWSDQSWNYNGSLVTGSSIGTPSYVDDLYFGYHSYDDPNGRTYNDYHGDLTLSSLNFANQSWTQDSLDDSSISTGVINVLSTSPQVQLNQTFYVEPGRSITANVAGNSSLFITKIVGYGPLYKTGDGTMTITKYHDHRVGTFVRGGRLIDHDHHGNYTVDSALEFFDSKAEWSSADIGFAGSIAGPGTFTKSGDANLTLMGSVGYTGDTFINEGRLIAPLPYSRNITIAKGASLEIPLDQNVTYSGRITGEGYYVMSGTGQMTLTGPNDYTGGTLVSTGTLVDRHPHGNYENRRGKLYLDVDGAQTSVIAGFVSDNGETHKTGTGTLTLNSIGAVTRMYVDEGRLVVQAPSGGTYYNYAALEFQTATNQTFSSRIFGPGTLTKSGAGDLVLFSGYSSNSPGFTGGTIVNEGRLIDYFPHGDYVTNADLEFANRGTLLFQTPNRISGTGNFTKSEAGELDLSAPLTYGGKTTINGGTVVILGTDLLPTTTALTVNANGTLDLRGIQTVATLAGDGKILSGGRLTVNGAAGSAGTTFSGVISGTGSLRKSGGGFLNLTGVNTYTGTTTVNGGILIDENPHGSYETNAALYFAKTGDLDYAAPITGTGSFNKAGAGTLTLSGASTYSGGTTVLAGRLIDMNPHGRYVTSADLEFPTAADRTFSGGIFGTGTLTKTGAGTLTLSGQYSPNDTTTRADIIVSEGRLIDRSPHTDYVTNAELEFANAGTVQFATPVPVGPATPNRISGTGNFTKSGGGELTLVGPSTYGGTTTVNGGVLVTLGANYLPTTTALTVNANAALELRGAQTVASLAGAGKVGTEGPLTVNGSASTAFSGVASGTGSLTKAGEGTLTLSGVNTYSGGTTVNAGTLGVTRGLVGGLSVASGATLDNATLSGLNLGAGTLDGTVRTSTLTRFAGPVTGAGGFTGTGKVEFDGGYSPGNASGDAPASVTFQSDLVLGATNGLTMGLGGTTPGTGYDHLTVGGRATLGGTLNVVSLPGFTLASGQSFDLFDFASWNGNFSSVNLPTLGTDLRWDTSTLYGNGTIRVQSVPEPATMLSLSLGALALLRRRKRVANERATGERTA